MQKNIFFFDRKRLGNLMKCPFCNTTLVSGPLKQYETLVEHVTNPNAEFYPWRTTHVCPNSECKTSHGGFWDTYGVFYTTDFSLIIGKETNAIKE